VITGEEAMADARLEGLLTDIARDPEDRSLYPILADFLEDQGEVARARLIRNHLEQETLSPDDPRLPGLLDEEDELLAEYGASWMDRPPPPGVCINWWLGRLYVHGFAYQWKGSGKDWLLRNALWLTGFSLSGAAEKLLADLITAGCLRLANRLELEDPGITDEGLSRLIRLPLRELHLSCQEVTARGLAHLEALPQLRELSLDRFDLSELAIAQLGRLTQLRDLKFWRFRGNRFEEAPVPEEMLEELRRRMPQCRIETRLG
jgi:uncharacterized protein (TIGR02996 family)